MNILIVDDDADSCEVMSRYLIKAGHEVRCVPNGREALIALGANVPDFIVLDVRMPGMDGVALLEVIRSYLRWLTVPVAVVTAYPEDQRIQRLANLKVSRIFRKSEFRLEELLECILQSTQREKPTARPQGRELPN